VACTVHTREPNRGIGRQKLQRFRDYIFLPILFVVLIPQKWVFMVKPWIRTRDMGTLHPVWTVSASLSSSFSAILKQGAMQAGF